MHHWADLIAGNGLLALLWLLASRAMPPPDISQEWDGPTPDAGEDGGTSNHA